MTNPAWAALITRIPATNDLPLTTLLDLIETSNADVKARTGNEIAQALSPQERARCRTAAALAHTQPHLTNAAGDNAGQAWAITQMTTAARIYRRHAKNVIAEIAANPFTYLRTHPRALDPAPAKETSPNP
ncbi:hypothetical protein [Pseudarthrobacter sp. B4EP4b]|uniref:hypothetical protein n=1 Tax=Pseudarthrobacter sp. B4EP4b TaxID=2590664 RepID=UPI0011522605|nr:hypothetical protein [Pseudarthrobacter sp. B4EP4b]